MLWFQLGGATVDICLIVTLQVETSMNHRDYLSVSEGKFVTQTNQVVVRV